MGRGHAGKIAVITGAAAGLGQAFARRLAEEGVDIGIADIQPADETEAMVKASGGTVLTQRCDVASPESVREFADAILARWMVDSFASRSLTAEITCLSNSRR